MHNNTLATLDALEDFLDKEHQAILNGSLKDMGRIAKEKEALLDKGAFLAPDRKTLEQVRRKVDRNHTLLAAAIRGVRAVSNRLEVLRNGSGEFDTYDKSGQRTSLGGHKGNLYRRA